MKEYDIYPFGDTTCTGRLEDGFDLTGFRGSSDKDIVVKWEQEKKDNSNVFLALGNPDAVIVRYYDLSMLGYVRERIIGYDVNAYPIVCVNLKYQVVRSLDYIRMFGDRPPDVLLFDGRDNKELLAIDGGRFAVVDKKENVPTEEDIHNAINGIKTVEIKNSQASYSGLGAESSLGELIQFQKSFVYWNVFLNETKNQYFTSVFYSSNFNCNVGGLSSGSTVGGSREAAYFLDPDGNKGAVLVGNGYNTGRNSATHWTSRVSNGWITSRYSSKMGKGLYSSGNAFANNSAQWYPSGLGYYIKKEYAGSV